MHKHGHPTPQAARATSLLAWSRTFPATAQQAGEARRFLAAVVEGCPAADDALLCLSELATNALLHSRSREPGGSFTVRAQRHGNHLRAEVCDQGGPWAPLTLTGPAGLNGRGLAIVDHLARAWGRGRRFFTHLAWAGTLSQGAMPGQSGRPGAARSGTLAGHPGRHHARHRHHHPEPASTRLPISDSTRTLIRRALPMIKL